MSVTTNVETMTRTAREMAEVQRDSYQALAESFTASQRRGAKLAQDGLRFFKLQEDNARAAQEWFANGVRLMQLQQRNADFAQEWLGGGVEALREQTEQNLRAADAVVRSARKPRGGASGGSGRASGACGSRRGRTSAGPAAVWRSPGKRREGRQRIGQEWVGPSRT